MSKQVQVRVTEEDHLKMKTMAAAANMTLAEFMHAIVQDEWQAYDRKDVQYSLLKKRVHDRSIGE